MLTKKKRVRARAWSKESKPRVEKKKIPRMRIHERKTREHKPLNVHKISPGELESIDFTSFLLSSQALFIEIRCWTKYPLIKGDKDKLEVLA